VEHAFGRQPAFSLGIEEELLLVSAPPDHALVPDSARVLAGVAPPRGSAEHDTYAACVELATPIVRTAPDGVAVLAALRQEVVRAGGRPIGCGIHPTAAFGDTPHVDRPRYRRIVASMRGLISRTPTCALHVHVGLPDPETAIRTVNGLRRHLPLLQGLAANSPFWHGLDSGLATARSALFRGYPRAEIPRAFADWGDYERAVAEVTDAGDAPDYTFLWWDVRPHPRLGTVEVRAMDSQSSLATVAGLAALVHALARLEAEAPAGAVPSREVLSESSFLAARDGLDAVLLHDGHRQRLRELARDTLDQVRPYARELGGEDALEEVERVLREGNGADRQRRAHRAGGFGHLLAGLVAETADAAA
jgi:carboxylate-amine ligase